MYFKNKSKSFLKVLKDIRIQGVHQTPDITNLMKTMPRHIIVKLLKVKNNIAFKIIFSVI